MTIALTIDDMPQSMVDQFLDFRRRGFAIVNVTDLAFLETHSKTSPRAQQDSAPVAQHLTTEQPPADPALEHRIEHTHTLNGIKLRTVIRTQTFVLYP